MLRYTLQRVVTMLVVAWVIVTLTFVMLHALPGGPFASDKVLPEAIMRNIEKRYHLDKPLWQQYVDYLGNVAVWDLGPSFKYEGMTVNQLINKGFPVSAAIGGVSVLISLVVGIPVGVIAAMRHNGLLDRTTSALAVLTAAAPSFVIAAVLQYYLGYRWRLFPPATWGTARHAVLPTLTLCSFTLAWVVKLTRSTMLEVIGQDYVRTARAKGLPALLVIFRHMLPGTLVPIIASVAPIIASVLVGSFIVESIFAIPGIGREFVQSISNRDYTVTLGMTVFLGLLLTGFTLAGDLLSAVVDPRIRLGKEG